MQEWGFRTVERLAYFGLAKAAKNFTYDVQDKVESLDLLGEKVLPLLKDLGVSDTSSEFGLSVEDFLNESGNKQATSLHRMARNAEGRGKARKLLSTRSSLTARLDSA
jgi:hypothetical protein